MSEFLSDAREFLPILFQGVQLTVLITVASLAVSTVLGLFWAMLRVSGSRVLSGFSVVMVNILRGIPIIVQLFYIYFVMPEFGVSLTAVQAGIIGLGIAYSAYQAENFRAGIEAVDRGQVEAARTLGMSHLQTMRKIVLPQAFRRMIPPFVNESVSLLKFSSLVSVLGVADLTYQAQVLSTTTFRPIEIFTFIAVVYFALCTALSFMANRLERRLARSD